MSLENSEFSNELIDMITLDEFIEQHPQPGSLRVIKIDTDGFDMHVIQGGMGFIDKNRPVIFFEYDSDLLRMTENRLWEILSSLKELDYDDVLFYDNFGRFLLSTSLREKK